MKRLVIGASAYIMFCLGICGVLLGVFNLIAIQALNDVFYVLSGMGIVAFVISWLLLKVSRQK
jgi:hypothetical protein